MDASIDAAALRIFEEWLDWPAAERDRRLLERCAGDTALLASIRRLIERDRVAAAVMPTRVPERPAGATREPPRRIGPWRLVDVIGVGGMGSVFRGERDDGLFQQTVAVKVVRPGLLSESMTARFAEERRILARLRHPNIAQLYDGGVDVDGHSWFVMEYVEGRPITERHAGGSREPRAIVAGFLPVCDAVQHAHENLIVHADLKPNNILVRDDDVVKLLDFGIGRFLEGGTQPADAGPWRPTVAPGTLVALTPGYAAPECRRGELPGTASDVYSLGVVLHELLTGVLPKEGTVLLARVRDPDLVAILQRALAPSLDDRYATVERFAADLKGWQRHQPVTARRRTPWYLASRFVRRYRIAVAAGTLITVAVVGGFILTTALYLRAERARGEADARFAEVRDLSRFMIYDLYDALSQLPGTTAARRSLADKAQSYLERLGAVPGAGFELQLDNARGLARLAALQGVPSQPNLGDVAAARVNLDAAAARLEELRRDHPPRRDVDRELARVLLMQAQVAVWADSSTTTARGLASRAAALLGTSEPGAAAEREQWHELRVRLRQVQIDVVDWDGAPLRTVSGAGRMLQELERWPAEMRQDERYPTARAHALVKWGDGLFYLGDVAGALEKYREADALITAADARFPDRTNVLYKRMLTRWSVGTTLLEQRRYAESLDPLGDTLELIEGLRRIDSRDQFLERNWRVTAEAYGDVLSRLGRHADAVALFERSVARTREMRRRDGDLPARVRDLAYSLLVAGNAQWRAGARDQACADWREGHELADGLRRARTLSATDRADWWPRLERRVGACAGPQPPPDLLEP